VNKKKNDNSKQTKENGQRTTDKILEIRALNKKILKFLKNLKTRIKFQKKIVFLHLNSAKDWRDG